MQPFDHVEAAKEAVTWLRTKGRKPTAKLLKNYGAKFGGAAFADDLIDDKTEFMFMLGVDDHTIDWMAQQVREGAAK